MSENATLLRFRVLNPCPSTGSRPNPAEWTLAVSELELCIGAKGRDEFGNPDTVDFVVDSFGTIHKGRSQRVDEIMSLTSELRVDV